MDGRVANLDSVVAASPLMPKKSEDDDWQPEALRQFAVKQPHLASEAGMSVTSLATTLVDEHGKPILDDSASVGSIIEEESEGEGWATETDRYGWEEEHKSMTSSQASISSQYAPSFHSQSCRRDSGESERTVRGPDMDADLREQLEGLSIGQDIRSELARRPPRDWKEQRERDNEGKKRGLFWRVLSMNAR